MFPYSVVFLCNNLQVSNYHTSRPCGGGFRARVASTELAVCGCGIRYQRPVAVGAPHSDRTRGLELKHPLGSGGIQRRGMALFLGCAIVVLTVTPATAGGIADDCCADLEERIADLEATTVRRGNSKLEMSIGGTVSHAALSWDDGQNTDTYIVGNDNDGTSFEIVGEVESINNSNWSAGYLIEVGMLTAQSSEVNQIDDNAREAGTLEINKSHIWVRNKNLGQLSWGEVGGSSMWTMRPR